MNNSAIDRTIKVMLADTITVYKLEGGLEWCEEDQTWFGRLKDDHSFISFNANFIETVT